MNGHSQELLTLQRDCPVTQIPSGETAILPQGAVLRVLQTLGGNVTVQTPDGRLVRIESKDVDALGEAFAKSLASEGDRTEAKEGPFDETRLWEELRTVYDPEIPVNLVDLGLVYECTSTELPTGGRKVNVKMTMTAPGCGMGEVLREDVRRKVLALPGVSDAEVELVWEPPWDQSRMSEAARLQLGWM